MAKQMAVGAGGKAVGVGKNERGGMHGVLRGEGLALARQLARRKDLIIRGRGNQCPKRGQKLEFGHLLKIDLQIQEVDLAIMVSRGRVFEFSVLTFRTLRQTRLDTCIDAPRRVKNI